MLLQFAVENYRSFRDRAVLSMLADPRLTHATGQVLDGPVGKKVLRATAVYGANGSGKSNLVKALGAFERMVLEGTRGDEPLPISRFKLDRERRTGPAHFEIELGAAGRRFSYGFEAIPKRVEAEWLYEIEPDGGEQLLFEREASAEPNRSAAPSIRIGARLSSEERRRAFLEFVADGTRPNQLFLAEAGQRNVVELEPVRAAIRSWTIVEPDAFYLPLFAEMENNPQFRELMSLVLKQAGTGVDEIQARTLPLENHPMAGALTQLLDAVGTTAPNPLSLFGERPGALRLDEGGRPEQIRLFGVHRDTDGEPVELDLADESDGTQRLLNLAPILHMMGQGPPDADALFAIDELERSLHPHLTRLLLQLFFARADKGAAAQVVFTTHDTNLLDLQILSRDSVWFMEKDPRGGSALYPLSELDAAQLDAIERQQRGLEKGYLQGRFGAVPFFGSLEALGLRKEDLR